MRHLYTINVRLNGNNEFKYSDIGGNRDRVVEKEYNKTPNQQMIYRLRFELDLVRNIENYYRKKENKNLVR